jgi:hypothetical protein
MDAKAQQQTLSIRISDTLREFLERAKQVIASGRGESVSTSDVAKILLESAKDDRLDFRLEIPYAIPLLYQAKMGPEAGPLTSRMVFPLLLHPDRLRGAF